MKKVLVEFGTTQEGKSGEAVVPKLIIRLLKYSDIINQIDNCSYVLRCKISDNKKVFKVIPL